MLVAVGRSSVPNECARIPRRRYPGGRLSDRPGAEVHGQLVEQRTNGRHRIHVFHSRQLGEEKETIEQTRAGAIDLNRTNVAPIGSLVPAANVLALPFLFRSFDHLHKVLDGEIGDEILAEFPAPRASSA